MKEGRKEGRKERTKEGKKEVRKERRNIYTSIKRWINIEIDKDITMNA